MASYEADAHGRRHRSVEIGVEPFVSADSAEPLHGDEYEEEFERAVLEEMQQGVNIPDVSDYRYHDAVKEAERDMDIGLLASLGIIGVGAAGAGIYIWRKHRNKE